MIPFLFIIADLEFTEIILHYLSRLTHTNALRVDMLTCNTHF
jgi:hypothetical protein